MEAAKSIQAGGPEPKLIHGKVNIAAYRKERGITGSQIAQTVRDAGFGNCDKQVVSKVENLGYGVQFVPDAEVAIFKRYGIPPEAIKGRRKASRSKPYRLTVRLTELEYRAVLLLKLDRGNPSWQEFLHDILTKEAAAYEPRY